MRTSWNGASKLHRQDQFEIILSRRPRCRHPHTTYIAVPERLPERKESLPLSKEFIPFAFRLRGAQSAQFERPGGFDTSIKARAPALLQKEYSLDRVNLVIRRVHELATN